MKTVADKEAKCGLPQQVTFIDPTGGFMSLTVSPQLLQQARQGEIDDAAFVDCVRESLPYAWTVVTGVIDDLRAGGGEFADNQTPPPDEVARGQLLRMMASDAMRAALERHFGVRLAFQNCHRVAAFRPGADGAYQEFVTTRAQILNQKPELVDC
jgi:uncharacterized protein